MAGMFSDLQLVALQFTDAITRTKGLSALTASHRDSEDTSGKFTIELGNRYKRELRKWLEESPSVAGDEAHDDAMEDLYAEACLVVSAYNMVSRFLVSTDVKGLSGSGVPWPLERQDVRGYSIMQLFVRSLTSSRVARHLGPFLSMFKPGALNPYSGTQTSRKQC
jgi:hypothetical protein